MRGSWGRPGGSRLPTGGPPPLRLTARRVNPACGPTHPPITDHTTLRYKLEPNTSAIWHETLTANTRSYM